MSHPVRPFAFVTPLSISEMLPAPLYSKAIFSSWVCPVEGFVTLTLTDARRPPV